MTDHDDHVRAVLPDWRRPLDTNARRMLGEIHEDDAPIVAQTPAGWLIVAKAPDGSDHSVVRPSYEEAAAFLASLSAAKESPHAETDQHEQASAIHLRDPGGADVAAAETGVRAADGGGTDGSGVDGASELEDAVPAQAAEYIAVEIEPEAPAESALNAEVTEAPEPTYGGTAFERDEIARLIKSLAVDIAYRREDLLASVARRIGEIAAGQVLYYNTPVHSDDDVSRFNAEQSEHATLLGRKATIERFADDARRGLEGKTLAYLQTIDVGAMPWPT